MTLHFISTCTQFVKETNMQLSDESGVNQPNDVVIYRKRTSTVEGIHYISKKEYLKVKILQFL